MIQKTSNWREFYNGMQPCFDEVISIAMIKFLLLKAFNYLITVGRNLKGRQLYNRKFVVA